mmetsp:Transcript_23661/g.40229  ORF Transcript_23661/g.40229 Transcript_23661/m.40229 type:complete len:225 (-) Transcript_23661:246-920(-)
MRRPHETPFSLKSMRSSTGLLILGANFLNDTDPVPNKACDRSVLSSITVAFNLQSDRISLSTSVKRPSISDQMALVPASSSVLVRLLQLATSNLTYGSCFPFPNSLFCNPVAMILWKCTMPDVKDSGSSVLISSASGGSSFMTTPRLIRPAGFPFFVASCVCISTSSPRKHAARRRLTCPVPIRSSLKLFLFQTSTKTSSTFTALAFSIALKSKFFQEGFKPAS